MQRQLKGLLYYLSTDIRYSLTIFWTILGSILLISLVADLIFSSEDITIAFDLSIPIYIFGAIVGYLTVKSGIPYLIKMGVTRMNLFIGLGIFFLGLALFNAIIANSINSVITALFNGNITGMIYMEANGETFTFNHIADIFTNSSTWLTRIEVDTAISFFLITSMFILGLVFYRFGLIGGFSILGVMMVVFVFGMTKGWLLDFFTSIFKDFSFVFFYQLFFTGLIIYVISYVLLRRITV